MPIELLWRLLRHRRAVVLGVLAAVTAAAWVYLLFGAGIETGMMGMGGGKTLATGGGTAPLETGSCLTGRASIGGTTVGLPASTCLRRLTHYY
jgi:predicted metal-binding membrane protein